MSTLFATTVANAKPHDKDYKLADGGGLYLLVRSSGASTIDTWENAERLPSVPILR